MVFRPFIACCAGVVAIAGCGRAAPGDCSANGTCPVPVGDGADAAAVDATTYVVTPPDTGPGTGADAATCSNGDGCTEGGVDAGVDADAAGDATACDPRRSPHDDACVVDEAYGVFVSTSGRDGAAGTRADPLRTIGDGVARAVQTGKSRVYVCDGAYAEAVSLSSTVSVYGALACTAGWGYVDGGSAQVLAGAGQMALTVTATGGPIAVEDMQWTAMPASGEDDAGVARSSIAALVAGAQVTFRRCSFIAGDGAKGADGQPASNYDAPAAPNGMPSGDAGAGGAGGSVQCNDGTSSQGGAGGSASALSAADGGGGSAMPMPAVAPPSDGSGSPGGSAVCSGNGHPGGAGGAGDGGVAAGAYGILSALGWAPTTGGGGQAGSPGQGGGGGGGTASLVQPLGGTGGGAGGCGGAGGTGGSGGGASIGLASIDASVTLQDCRLMTAAGGNGGHGADGQPGQGGGLAPASTACAGGAGGNGGGGAGGAGGNGGLSVCILFQGTPPSGSPTCVTGNAGAPGAGGAGADGGTNGATVPAPAGAHGAGGLPGASQPMLRLP